MKKKGQGTPTDAEFMANPMLWPHLLLPIKRTVRGEAGGQRLEVAYMLDGRPIIYKGSIYGPKPEDEKEEFKSHEAIIAAGWKVD